MWRNTGHLQQQQDTPQRAGLQALPPPPWEGAGLKKRKAANGWVCCGAMCDPNALKKLEELKGSLGKNFSFNVKRSGSL